MKNVIVFFMIYALTISYSFSQCTATITNSINNICFGDSTGSATVNGNGGIVPYTYLWSNNNTSQTAVNLGAGTYTVTVTDSIGCIAISSITILQPSQLNLIIVNIDSSHCGMADGSIVLSVIGGAAPYMFSLDGGMTYQVSGTYYNIPAGVYYALVRDVNGCAVIANIIINDLPPVPPIITTTPTCLGSCTGTATCIVQGNPFDYYYNWGNGSSTQTISNLCQGYYFMTLSDNNGCISVYDFTIEETTNPMVKIFGDIQICYGESDTLIASVHCGTEPYTYLWNQGILSDSVIIISPNSTSLYTVTITDALGLNSVDSFNIIVNPNCGNRISGYVFKDLNSNGIKDSNDVGVSGKVIQIMPGSSYAYTDNSGYYISYNAGIGNYSITLPNHGYNILSPDTNYSNFSTIGMTDSLNNFALQYMHVNDLEITINSGNARPGFNNQTFLYCKNNGTDTMNAIVKYKYDSTFVYQTSSPIGVNYAGDSIIWTIQNIIPNQTKYLGVTFYIPTNIPLGTILNHDAFVYPIIGDTTPNNNYFHLQRVVTGSYDPNDKSVNPEKYMTLQQIEDRTPFIYTIRFQNTGTDTAFNIKIKDTLSQNVDITSFEMIASSHPYSIKIIGQNIIEWSFENILLPDSNTNEELSHGYVQYRIKPNDNLTLNDFVSNTAYIYFDFNEAVITNTVTDTICETITNIKHQENSNDNISIYPNPFHSLTNIDLTIDKLQELEISILNSLGEKLEHKKYGKLSNDNHHIIFENKLTKLTCGFYLFEIKIGEKLYYKKAYIY